MSLGLRYITSLTDLGNIEWLSWRWEFFTGVDSASVGAGPGQVC